MNASTAILSLREFGVAFGDRVVLNNVNLHIDGPGVLVVMGPMSTGKSTLLRTVAGINQAVGNFRSWGDAEYLGAPIGPENAPALVAQNARLLMSTVQENIINDLPERNTLTMAAKRDVAKKLLKEAGLDSLLDSLGMPVVELPLAVQRHLAIARTAASNPGLLCVDEPTANLEWNDALSLLKFLKQQSGKCGVLVVSHNQQDALELGGETVLLAGGSIQHSAPAQQFFTEPESPLMENFIRTGTCSLPSPGAKPEEVDESMHAYIPVLPEAATNYVREALGPRGFTWVKKGLLAGCPRPGIVQELEYDLEALKRVGIKTLVSLTTQPVDPEMLKHYGIEGIHMPIVDMHAPEMDEAENMCRQISEQMAKGMAVAYHCRAGLGRTGTMLASHLILEGKSALEALESVRRYEPRWVQSEEQIKFLERFAESLANRQGNGRPKKKAAA